MGFSSSSSGNYVVFGGANGIYTIEYDLRTFVASDSNYKYTSALSEWATYVGTSDG